jgi:hypothetical protein
MQPTAIEIEGEYGRSEALAWRICTVPRYDQYPESASKSAPNLRLLSDFHSVCASFCNALIQVEHSLASVQRAAEDTPPTAR